MILYNKLELEFAKLVFGFELGNYNNMLFFLKKKKKQTLPFVTRYLFEFGEVAYNYWFGGVRAGQGQGFEMIGLSLDFIIIYSLISC